MIWIFDIETYKNFFSAIFKNPETKEIKEFVIFKDRNDLDSLINFIKDPKKWFIGYNNYYFDNQLLNFLQMNHFALFNEESDSIARAVYNVATKIVDDKTYNEYKYNSIYNFVDLMKVGGFYKSLKLLGVNLRWHKLQDLPIPWDSEIQEDQLELLLKYNRNDIEITEQLYKKLYPQIKMRSEISDKYNVNVLSDPESGIANKLLDKFYSEATGLKLRDFRDLRTNRKIIFFNTVVFPTIYFESPELQKLLETIKSHTWYESVPFFKKSVIFGGTKYDLGVGGLHSDDKGDIFESNDEQYIIDADIASFYPNIIINHNIVPAHLDKSFIKQYKDLKDVRLKAKKEGNSVVAGALKIVINSVFGKLNHKKHWLYDPMAAYRVTVNGQLYLLMLIEKLVLNGFKVISANTDGIVTIVDKNKEELYKEICEEWEYNTSFELEFTKYKRYIRRDVNNYICVTEDGDIKSKGIFVIPDIDSINNRKVLESLVKGFDKPIISIALYNYFIKNIPIEKTIRDHTDIYDFCIAKKIDDKFANEFHTLKDGERQIDILQKSVRFFISKDGGKLLKTGTGEDDRIIDYCVNHRVTIFNDYIKKDMEDYNIDYDYYISETYKILYNIENQQLKLF